MNAVLDAESTTPPWATELRRYIQDHAPPEDEKEVERVARQYKMYVLIDGALYRRQECGVKLLCIS
jgi:hypothetical protein